MLLPKAIALAFVFASFASAGNLVGQPCSTDGDCSINETCKINAELGCNQGVCTCIACHGVAHPGEPCSPRELRKPCDTKCSQRQCDASCSMGSDGEVYPDNARCSNSFWPGYSLVKCDKCFNLIQGRCVREPNTTSPIGSVCSTDCDCTATSSCLAKCQCPPGQRWDNVARKCRQALFGEPCQFDSDCRHSDFDFHGVCLAGVCSCFDKTSRPQIMSRLEKSEQADDELWTLVNATICVALEVEINMRQETENCTIAVESTNGTDYHYDICENGVCVECPMPKNETAELICRTFSAENVTNTESQTCEEITDESNYSFVGELCQSDDDCGTNAYCKFHPVEPLCDYGVCTCASCATPVKDGNYSLCTPIVNLALGESCNSGLWERYPENAHCSDDDNVVTCKASFLRRGSEPNCIPLKTGAALGSFCRRYSDDCQSNLECAGEQTCQCPGTNSWWDEASNQCKVRLAGEECLVDDDCNDATSATQGFICQTGTCVCDDRFDEGQVKCQENVTLNETPCQKCPEDDEAAPCRSNEAPKSAVLEQCFAEEEQMSLVCQGPLRPTLGRSCFEDRECGVNEVCTDQGFQPACLSKQCQCKPCFERAANGTCSPIVNIGLGQSCSNADNELFSQGLVCRGGQVQCDECYNLTDGKCSWEPAGQPGDSCEQDCECVTRKCIDQRVWFDDGDAALKTSDESQPTVKMCLCEHRFEIWDEAKLQCIMREFGDACGSDLDCQAEGKAGQGYSRRSGAACVDGTCGCAAGYTAVTASFLKLPDKHAPVTESSPTPGSFVVDKTICVLESAKPFLNASIGDSCLLDPIYHAGDAKNLAFGICAQSTVCVKCPYDFGTCRKVNDPILTAATSRNGCQVATLL